MDADRSDLHRRLLFGIATFRTGILPRWCASRLPMGTRLAPIASQLPNVSHPKVAVPVGVAFAWLGDALWSERRTQHELASQATTVPGRSTGGPAVLLAEGSAELS